MLCKLARKIAKRSCKDASLAVQYTQREGAAFAHTSGLDGLETRAKSGCLPPLPSAWPAKVPTPPPPGCAEWAPPAKSVPEAELEAAVAAAHLRSTSSRPVRHVPARRTSSTKPRATGWYTSTPRVPSRVNECHRSWISGGGGAADALEGAEACGGGGVNVVRRT